MEGDQRLADVVAGTVREGLGVPGREPRERVPGIEGLPPRGEAAEPVVAAARDEFGVYDLALALDVFAVEPRSDEELGEPVERTFEVRGVHVEEEARVGERGGGVAGSAVLAEEAVVLAGVRVLLRAEKQHVFEKVCEARALVRVVAAAHVDVERGGRLVRVRIGDHQRHQSVVEHECPVLAGVGGAAFHLDALECGGAQGNSSAKVVGVIADPMPTIRCRMPVRRRKLPASVLVAGHVQDTWRILSARPASIPVIPGPRAAPGQSKRGITGVAAQRVAGVRRRRSAAASRIRPGRRSGCCAPRAARRAGPCAAGRRRGAGAG